MAYKNLRACLLDLERNGHLVRITEEVDPFLEMAEIQRRVYQARGPALWYMNVKGTPFPCASNIFGTMERTRFIFRDTLEAVKKLVELKIDPSLLLKKPLRYSSLSLSVLNLLPMRRLSGAVFAHQCRADQLPQIQCWPKDGGAFITLPQVYTEHPDFPGRTMSNLGMYRIQISGGKYAPNEQAGLHYQIHRGIGVHHHAAIRRGEKLKVSVFVGGAPALAVAAVMPLPEGLSELAFAGALGGRRFRYVKNSEGYVLACDADFCMIGTVDPHTMLPEGPFGDHLGYYSLTHEFPVMKIEKIFHRRDAIWPFTVVGRPPQEDTTFGELVHEIAGPVIPTLIPGLHAVHAVDAAGVHPLLLAIGSERYVPYGERRPQEILTIAHALLGQGQISLAKYLFIIAKEDDPDLNIHNIQEFLIHALQRVNWETDLHFETRTTIDTLDYSGAGLNEGSKVVIAAAGGVRRELGTSLPRELSMPDGFHHPKIVMPGVLTVGAPAYRDKIKGEKGRELFCQFFSDKKYFEAFPLIVLTDDSEFAAKTLNNFLWVAFTRSNPAADISGVDPFVYDKHWGCRGPLVIDARMKPHHAPPLEEDPEITKRVDALAAPGKSLHGII